MREPIRKSLRFEVFKRDSFTCQYCGRKAPEIVLHCDHIQPVVSGGATDILNLVTSCADCNLGKGKRALDDHGVLEKQQAQLEELQQRREQIEMMIEWRDGLSKLDGEVVDRLAQRWSEVSENSVSLTPTGKDALRKLITKFGVDLILRAMTEAISTYARREGDAHAFTKESLDTAFDRLGGIAKVLSLEGKKPHLKQLYYIRGILRNRLSYLNEHLVMDLMEEAVAHDVDLEWLTGFARRVSSWTAFRDTLQDFIQEQNNGSN